MLPCMLIQRQNSLCRPARNYGVTRFSEILLSRMKFLENYEIIWKKTKKKSLNTYNIEKNGKINTIIIKHFLILDNTIYQLVLGGSFWRQKSRPGIEKQMPGRFNLRQSLHLFQIFF